LPNFPNVWLYHYFLFPAGVTIAWVPLGFGPHDRSLRRGTGGQGET
jgi:hypothetical protein